MPSSATLAKLRHWRLNSASAHWLDRVMVLAGVAVIVVTVADSLISWPSNAIWISPSSLEHAMAFVLIPTWVWLMLGFALLHRRGSNRPRLRGVGTGRVVGLVMLSVLCLAVVIGGFIIGGAKGSLRVEPLHR